MISPKKLIRMARKWQKVAALGRKRISLGESIRVWMQTAAARHHEIFRELFQMSEEEFGIQSDGPIILPCDSVFMDYVISFIQRGIGKDLERALIMSMASSNCSSSSYFHQEQNNEQLLLCVF
ncbi:Auxin-responsive protein SAUR64 [Vitis vinifera]|uniref:Auxin-responsive protein SAUR64 n=1 Tax=Vitis vinifera TaxID=29760 RepID=A0A438JTL3_VITVI|nr:Auxin-responsive protein SAUR64 [Vitis vinifera]